MSGLVIDLTLSFVGGASWYIYVVGIALEACDYRLQIRYVDDMRFLWRYG